jgi:chromosome segregation ATPase
MPKCDHKIIDANNLTKIRSVYLGLTYSEYYTIERKYKTSTCHSLSEYLRKLLLGKPVTIIYRNQSLEDLIEEIVPLNNQINSVRDSVVELLEKLSLQDQIDPLTPSLETLELQINQLCKTVGETKKQIEKITHQWSQS